MLRWLASHLPMRYSYDHRQLGVGPDGGHTRVSPAVHRHHPGSSRFHVEGLFSSPKKGSKQVTETLQPATCGDIWVGDDGTYACTNYSGHAGQHDDAGPGMAPWEITVWGDK